jgi:hypothetical protein
VRGGGISKRQRREGPISRGGGNPEDCGGLEAKQEYFKKEGK